MRSCIPVLVLLGSPVAASATAVYRQSVNRYVVGQERPIDQKLFAAIQAGRVDQVRNLLAAGADPNANEADGWRPLLMLEGTPEQTYEMAKMLVAKGAKVNYRQPGQGWTPLTASLNRHQASEKLVDFLLSKGANPNAADSTGFTPLHFAIRDGDLALIKTLVAKGASLVARTKPSPRMLSTDPVQKRQLAINAEEIGHNFEPGYDFGGKTPAFSIVGNFRKDAADYLLKIGVDFRATDYGGWTVLHDAVKAGDLESVKWLLGIGLDPNAASKGGYRPLHIAMRVGFGVPDVRVIPILLKAGANPKLANRDGQKPEDELRADVAWRLRPDKPEVRNDPGVAKMLLSTANSALTLVDPGASPITAPSAVAGRYGMKYDSIDFFDVVAQRRVRVENGKTILRLLFEAPKQSSNLVLKNLLLNDYEPLKPQPIKVALQKGRSQVLEIDFPKEAGTGGSVDADYEFAGTGGGGSFHEGVQISPTISYGKSVELLSEVAGRVMQIRLDKVTLNGKPLPAFAGRVYRLDPNRNVTTGLPVPSPKRNLVISYSVNLVPNIGWTHETIVLN